jgi:hypothetical protein
VFEGDGFGVGLTVTPRDLDPACCPVPDGVEVRPTRLSELLPVSMRSAAGKAAELERVQMLKAQLAAYEAAVIVSFADDRPDTDDVPAGAPGAASPDWAPVDDAPAGVSEFFVDELAAALGTSVTSASHTWSLHSTLHDRLPGTWRAMADGELDLPRGRAIAAEVARSPSTEPMVLLAGEAAVLPVARELTVTRLRARVRAELVAHDALFAERCRKRAERRADTTVRPSADAPGRAEFAVDMSIEDAYACWDVADQEARAAKAAGDPRPVGVLRCEAVLRRLLRDDTDPDRPPIHARVTVVAPLDALEAGARPDPAPDEPVVLLDAEVTVLDPAGGTPTGPPVTEAVDPVTEAIDPTGQRTPTGQVNGQPITHRHLRELLQRVDALCPGGLQSPTGGSLQFALTDPDGALRTLLSPPDLRRLVRVGCPDHPRGTDCGCGLVDRPPAVDRYRPSAPQYRFIHTRDRRCRMPGCTTRAAWADVDHVVAHCEGGSTDCDNLCCLCRRHHRLKTFGRGWSFVMTPDGTLVVTTPSGITRIDRPPGIQEARSSPARAGPAPPLRYPVPGPDDPPPF